MSIKLSRKIQVACFICLQLLVSTFLFLPSTASAQTQNWQGRCVRPVLNRAGREVGEVATIEGLECLIANVFTVALTVIGLFGFAMIIIASFHWMTSGGNTKGLETARNTLRFVLVGIVVALSAFAVINLISAFTGIDIITRFRIPSSQVNP